MFNHAVERKYIDRNPFDSKIKNYPKKSKQGRELVYDENEIELMSNYLNDTMRDIVSLH